MDADLWENCLQSCSICTENVSFSFMQLSCLILFSYFYTFAKFFLEEVQNVKNLQHILFI